MFQGDNSSDIGSTLGSLDGSSFTSDTYTSQQRVEKDCRCSRDPSPPPPFEFECECPRDEHGLRAHKETCVLHRNETLIFPHEVTECECVSPRFEGGICRCCSCPKDQCRCKKSGKEAFELWRANRDVGPMPAVLDSEHPLMQRFQKTLKDFLERENAIAQDEIIRLRDELQANKVAYDKDLEAIYKHDHDTNAQRELIEDYEKTLSQKRDERLTSDQKMKEIQTRHAAIHGDLEKSLVQERESTQEFEALSALCKQLEKWRDETESDLTVSNRMSEKMRAEKKELAKEKRELDIVIYNLSNEVWNLESKLELYKKQIEIKNNEMENVSEKVTAYSAELEDLELDKRRLVALWNSVLVNIKQRDKVYDSVREDYRQLQDNYRTLVFNLEATRKMTDDEMQKGKELAMQRDKINSDLAVSTKAFDIENNKRLALEAQIAELGESIEMTERDEELIKMENTAMGNTLKTTQHEYDKKTAQRLKMENEILDNLQDCLLNDKAVESMAKGIRKMREMCRKHEIALTSMENQHASIMLDIEIHRSRQARNNAQLEESLAMVRKKENFIKELEEKLETDMQEAMRRQRDLDLVMKKHKAMEDLYMKRTPQERRIDELESHIKGLREKTESMQHEWLRLQGHVVKLTTLHHRLVSDTNLIGKQIQICEQKSMRIQADCEAVRQDRAQVERELRLLRGRLEFLARTRKDANKRNFETLKMNQAIVHEYTANLKDAEAEILSLEEDISNLEKEKTNLTEELDKCEREALVWQRKGIMAVELKRNIQDSKSRVGDIGQMRSEIHRMEVRREQLRRTSEKLNDDLIGYIHKREAALNKARATAAVEKSQGNTGKNTTQFAYKHKLRLAKADVVRVTKDLDDAKEHLEFLKQEKARIEHEIAETSNNNDTMEDQVATMITQCRDLNRSKHWLLERAVRKQRLSQELLTAIKRQSLKLSKSTGVIEEEYANARSFAETLKYILETLQKEYPHLEERWAIIENTLDIHTPTAGSPRSPPEPCRLEFEEEEFESYVVNVAEKPFEEGEEEIEEESTTDT